MNMIEEEDYDSYLEEEQEKILSETRRRCPLAVDLFSQHRDNMSMEFDKICSHCGKLIMICTCALMAGIFLMADSSLKIISNEEDVPHYHEQPPTPPPLSWSSLLVTSDAAPPSEDDLGWMPQDNAIAVLQAHWTNRLASHFAAVVGANQSENAALLS